MASSGRSGACSASTGASVASLQPQGLASPQGLELHSWGQQLLRLALRIWRRLQHFLHFVLQPQSAATSGQPHGSTGASQPQGAASSQGAGLHATGLQHLLLRHLRTFLHLAGLQHLLRSNSPAEAWLSPMTAKPAITTIKAIVHVITRFMSVVSSEEYTCLQKSNSSLMPPECVPPHATAVSSKLDLPMHACWLNLAQRSPQSPLATFSRDEPAWVYLVLIT